MVEKKEEKKPAAAGKKPAGTTKKPADAGKKPAGAAKPAGAGKKPAGTAKPAGAGKKPAGSGKPAGAGKKPAATGKKPAPGAKKPTSGVKRPAPAGGKPAVAGKKAKVTKKKQDGEKKPGAAKDKTKVATKKVKLAKKKLGRIPRKPISKSSSKKLVKAGRVRFGTKRLPSNAFIEKPIGGEKNGGTRLVRVKKLPAYYATQHNPKKRPKRVKHSKRPLRASITPGTVCILLAGIHKGKKVIFLKELTSGLCLVTGPFKINGCPLRRVNQIYLIATSTKVDISGFGIPKHLTDKYFRRHKETRPRKEEGDIFEQKQEKYVASASRKKDQAVVDGNVIAAIRKREDKKFLFGYLGTPFGLKNRVYPHRLKF